MLLNKITEMLMPAEASRHATVSVVVVETIGGDDKTGCSSGSDDDNSNNDSGKIRKGPKTPTKKPMVEVSIPIDSESPQEISLSSLHNNGQRFDEGYNSDGHAGPWCIMTQIEGEQELSI